MVPPRHWLLVRAPRPFAAELREGDVRVAGGRSLSEAGGGHFLLLRPLEAGESARPAALAVSVAADGDGGRTAGELLILPDAGRAAAVDTAYRGEEAAGGGLVALCTNGRGAMSHVRAAWGRVCSQYDALLAANLHPDYPIDRRVLLTRCRGWVVHLGYSQEIGEGCLARFWLDADGRPVWRFDVPVGLGRRIRLDVRASLLPGQDALDLEFFRRAGDGEGALADADPVALILRPDIEDRSFHGKSKAYTGPEWRWPQAVRPESGGFVFAPGGHALRLHMPGAAFTPGAEWSYMVPHAEDAERGLDGSSDLFSPGYFSARLQGGEGVLLRAEAVADGRAWPQPPPGRPGRAPGEPGGPAGLDRLLRRAMGQFLARRDDGLTVIAGYPWFLDWGRDTLICVRGLAAAGMVEECRAILRAFARLESNGTLQNMIRGGDGSNRDTSDAPLWFFTSCADVMRAEGSGACLEMDCGGRSLREVLVSIGRHVLAGMPNGVRADAASGLVFSPAHFTWMDTNHPAGSPREGYPVEIQALWHAALALLARADPAGGWAERARTVRESIRSLFWRPDLGHLSDCLHASPGREAAAAEADDALRPNQLLAVTLGAVNDPEMGRAIVRSCEELLVPGAIRSLADRPVKRAIPVRLGGRLLNDPLHPYWGRYAGDEDTRRKPAYHNGTAWTWLFPSYCEALASVWGGAARDAARALLLSGCGPLREGCAGQLPELLDGDAPHAQRGCRAQAWGVTEFFRVLALLA